MAEFATYFENAIIDLMRSTGFTEVSVYVALFTDSATDAELEAGTLTNEVSGGAYERQLAGLSAPSDGVSSNASDITFPQATADWGTIKYVALMDASSGGNILMWSQLDANKTINNGDTFKINSTELEVTVA
jgi:hypothetical protein